MWILYALLSNLAFTVQDLVAYRYTSAKALNSFAVGAGFHLWVAAFAPILYFIYKFYDPKTPNLILGAYDTAKQAGLLLSLYALLLFGANGLLYYAYDIGARNSNINPGITASLSNVSLIISSLLPVIFFQAQLTMSNILGIVIYFIGGWFLTRPKRNNASPKRAKPISDKDVDGYQWWKWLFLAVGSGLLYGLAAFCGFLITKRTRTSAGSSIFQSYALYVTQGIISLMLALVIVFDPSIQNTGILKNYSFDLYNIFSSPAVGLPILLGGFGGAAGIAALYRSYAKAPNPGFSDAISNLYVASTAIASWILYDTPLSSEQMVGMVLSGVSISLLST